MMVVRSKLVKICSKVNTVKLRSGNNIPLFGLGCYKLLAEETSISVTTALDCGYRLIDTAEQYGNESSIGAALQRSNVKRSDIYISTKVSYENGCNKAKQSCYKSLKALGVDYIDLYLIHSPVYGKVLETWEALIELRDKGCVKDIGVSNFNVQHLKPFLRHKLELPSVNQIEFHPWNMQNEVLTFCRNNNIHIMGYCPLARMVKLKANTTPLCVKELMLKYNKTATQIILRWCVQQTVTTIPKSSNPLHIKENCDIFDFSLTLHEIAALDKLNENFRVASVTAMSEPWFG